MKILKFGGTSLATAERMQQAAEIVFREASVSGPPVVVVSAMGGVTNDLLRAADLAAKRDEEWIQLWRALRDRHLEAIAALDTDQKGTDLPGWLRERMGDLEDLLHGVFLLRECSRRTRDSIVSFGERLSAPLFALCITQRGIDARAVDARELIVTDGAFGNARVRTEPTRTATQRVFADRGSTLAVVTGFISATERGETTTLGRGGSDYTAALIGDALGAEVIELWTDVSGVLSADPRKVAEAFPLPRISYDELMELSHFGAKVVHPPSVHPARRAGIPLAIRNTLVPEDPGTIITGSTTDNAFSIRGLSSIPQVDLFRLEGDGMVGVPGIAMRLFGCLARANVSVILISQASSEHSICCAVSPDDTAAAEEAVAREFELEIRVGAIDPLIVDHRFSVIAIVGEGMRERPGIASRLFGSLGRRGINVRAVAQGSSELNISLVVDSDDEVAALRAVHSTFFGAPRPTIDLALLGCGQVGSEVLRQSSRLFTRWAETRGIDLRWVAIANSRQLLVDHRGIVVEGWREALAAAPTGSAMELLEVSESRPTVVIDTTASDVLSEVYPAFLEHGWAVVAANKKPLCGSYQRYSRWQQLSVSRRAPLLYEATVGAGLPVLSTLRGQIAAGDTLHSVVGVVSGSLSFLCEELRAGRKLSEALRQADELGYLEPNPWDDLSGEDARRKLVILAREAGFPLELSDVDLTPFLPDASWGRLTANEFWDRVPELDADFARRWSSAKASGRRWRYVISFDGTSAKAGLVEVGADHPCYGTQGPESLIAFTTEHYCDAPLVVRGPGAGPAVTASGVLVDVVRCLESLAPSL